MTVNRLVEEALCIRKYNNNYPFALKIKFIKVFDYTYINHKGSFETKRNNLIYNLIKSNTQ